MNVNDVPPSEEIRALAAAYFKLLTSIDWSDTLLVSGLREGLNKFLSNAHLALYRGKNKYQKSHFVSPAALALLQSPGRKDLRFEHMVPKQSYLQSKCEASAREGKITLAEVERLLGKYWRIATITADEEKRLSRVMPNNWDQNATNARYVAAGIELHPNPLIKLP